MKLILAIINHDDANTVTQALTKKGFSSTKLATTGGFLMAGNVTILIGVDEEKVQTVIDIIREHSHSRKQMIPTTHRDELRLLPLHARGGRGGRRHHLRGGYRAV